MPEPVSPAVNAGGRLDRLPIGPFHRRIMWLIGIGMFFDGFDIYIAATVLGAPLVAVAASYLPMLAALMQDPARVLSSE